jgi:hypothetical protein
LNGLARPLRLRKDALGVVEMKILAAVIVLMVTLAGPAIADWQYTRWGMSSEELEAFGKGNIARIPPGQQKNYAGSSDAALLRSGYRADDVYFDVTYYFTNNRLSSVLLKTESLTDGARARHTLEGLYGVPERKEPIGGNFGTMIRWRSERDGNMITFTNYPVNGTDTFFIHYEPIPSGKSGL